MGLVLQFLDDGELSILDSKTCWRRSIAMILSTWPILECQAKYSIANIINSDPLSVLNQEFVTFLRAAIAANQADPCSSAGSPLCQAVKEQALFAMMEDDVDYPRIFVTVLKIWWLIMATFPM